MILDILQVLGIVGTLVFVVVELRQQSNAIREEGMIRGFNLYHTLVQQYLNLLARADQDPELNAVWDEIEPARKAELDAAQQRQVWGAWHIMTVPERRRYRLTRSALETFEQAYLVHQMFHQRKWFDKEAWLKWRAWMAIWKNSPYFTYMFNDCRPRMVKTFADNFFDVATGDLGRQDDVIRRVPATRDERESRDGTN